MFLLDLRNKTADSIHKMSLKSRFAVALFVSLVVMIFVVFITKQIVIANADNQFEKDSLQVKKTLDDSLSRYSDLVISLHSFVRSNNNDITQLQFDKYTDSLSMSSKYPAIYMVEMTENVYSQNLQAFYTNLAREYSTDNPNIYYNDLSNTIEDNMVKDSRLIDNRLNAENVVIKYVSPIELAYPYVGLNLSIVPEFNQELVEGRKSKSLSSNGKVYISKKPNKYPFVSMNFAVFKESKDIDVPAVYRGSVGASIRLDKTLFGELNENLSYIDFQIFSPEEDGKTLIYDSRFNRESIDVAWPKELFSEEGNKLSTEKTFKLGKRDFFIKVFSKNLPPNVANMSMVAVTGILFFTFTFCMIYFGFFKKIERQEVSEKTEEHMIHLEKQANTDELTGLLNRRAFFSDLDDIINQEKFESNSNMYLLFIDLDGFKRVNDTLGHSAGDIVLKEYANRLKEFAQKHPCNYYRLGGDEFTVFIRSKLNERHLTVSAVESFAKNLLSLTDIPFHVRDEEFSLSQSIGIAEFPADGTTPDVLFKNSDMAMYEAKKKGKNCYLFFSKCFFEELEKKNRILNLLTHAVEKEEFYLEFQPKMQKENEHYYIKGVEALLRWNSPKLGIISPNDFIPLAEENGLMPHIGDWLIKKVAQTMHDWNQDGLENLTVAINVSAKQFSNDMLPDYYASVLSQYNIKPSNITIEITESAMMKEPIKTKDILSRFREYGFGVSVDDFGTGHSSLSYLRQFPVTEIKIDKSFTDDILIDQHDSIIVEGIISMSQKLNLDVIVEGVETIDQVEWIEDQALHGRGIKIQGYYFSKPLKEDALKTFVSLNKIMVN